MGVRILYCCARIASLFLGEFSIDDFALESHVNTTLSTGYAASSKRATSSAKVSRSYATGARQYGGLKDSDRIFTNLYNEGSPYLDGALKRVRAPNSLVPRESFECSFAVEGQRLHLSFSAPFPPLCGPCTFSQSLHSLVISTPHLLSFPLSNHFPPLCFLVASQFAHFMCLCVRRSKTCVSWPTRCFVFGRVRTGRLVSHEGHYFKGSRLDRE